MSGRTGDTTAARGVAVPADEEIPQVMVEIVRRMEALEAQLVRINDLSESVGSLQQAQTTVQQSVNLIQAAHNALHESLGDRAPAGSGGAGVKPNRVMDNKLMIPPKFNGLNGPSDLPWRIWAKKSRRYVRRTSPSLAQAMATAEATENPIANEVDIGISPELDGQLEFPSRKFSVV